MSQGSDSVRFEEPRPVIDNAGANSGEASPDKEIEGKEIELKLACSPQCAEAVANSPVLAERRRGEPRDLTLTATYYDTHGHDLLRSNTVLRVRTDGDHFVMTAKTSGAEGGKALAMAGGPNRFAGSSLYIVRDNPPRRIPIDIKRASSGEHPEENLIVLRGDLIVVP